MKSIVLLMLLSGSPNEPIKCCSFTVRPAAICFCSNVTSPYSPCSVSVERDKGNVCVPESDWKKNPSVFCIPGGLVKEFSCGDTDAGVPVS